MREEKSRFTLFFGNRGFFLASLIAGAHRDFTHILKKSGYETLILDKKATRYDAVKTIKEGEIYSNFLQKNRGKFDGVVLSLPNFRDETGAVAALKEEDVPILIQAYPDEQDKKRHKIYRERYEKYRRLYPLLKDFLTEL